MFVISSRLAKTDTFGQAADGFLIDATSVKCRMVNDVTDRLLQRLRLRLTAHCQANLRLCSSHKDDTAVTFGRIDFANGAAFTRRMFQSISWASWNVQTLLFGAGHENQSSGSFTEDGSARIGLPVRSDFVNFSVDDAGHLDALAATFAGAGCRRFVLVTLGVQALN